MQCNVYLKHLPTLLAYKIGMIDNSYTKEKVFYSCFKDMEEDVLSRHCIAFKETLESFCKTSALEKMKWHKQQHHKIVLVSASFEEYLRPLCMHWEIDLLATTMQVENGRLTGKFAKPNCYGKEKERRIKEKYDLKKYDYIYAYGDTRGDKEMLDLASPNLAFFRVFN